MERKFIDLRSLKVKESGPGEIEGHRAVFNVIDEGGDLILPGAFKNCIEEYLSSGFTAHSHDWSFSEAIGFPIKAHEDDYGFFVVSRFHSTSDAQDIRTKAKERLAAGKTVGFSFGYSVNDYEVVQRGSYKTILPRYLRSASLAEGLAKAERFPQVRLLKQVTVIEDSLVTAPMNKLARATAAKDQGRVLSDAETWALRRRFYEIRNRTLRAIYFPEEKSSADLRREGMALRRRAEKMLSEVDATLRRSAK